MQRVTSEDVQTSNQRKQMNDVTKCQSSIIAFGGSRLTVVGEVLVRVWARRLQMHTHLQTGR